MCIFYAKQCFRESLTRIMPFIHFDIDLFSKCIRERFSVHLRIASFAEGGNNDAYRLYAGERRIPDASVDSLPPALQHPACCTRVLAYARPRVGDTCSVRCTRYVQKTSSRDLHNTGLYLKVTRLFHSWIAFNVTPKSFLSEAFTEKAIFLPFVTDTRCSRIIGSLMPVSTNVDNFNLNLLFIFF